MTFAHNQHSSVHLLSKKSQRLERDTFFFRPNSFGFLIGGLNRRLTKVTAATLNRWGKLCDSRCPRFYLRPVKLKKCGILTYTPESMGDAIGPESTDTLESGDYTIEVKDCDMADPFDFNNMTLPFISSSAHLKSFSELEGADEVPEHLKVLRHWNVFPTGLEDIIAKRDGMQCMITGTKNDVGVSWIFPPAWADLSSDMSHLENHEGLRVPSNAMLMQKSLISAFHDNAFGIDVDDNYRIVVFCYTDQSKDDLAHFRDEVAYLSHCPACTSMRGFLRQHFRRCVLVNFRGGGISEDYPYDMILETMEALGVGSDDEPDDMVSLGDPLWSTPLGREIFENYMKVNIIPVSTTEDSLNHGVLRIRVVLSGMCLFSILQTSPFNRMSAPKAPAQQGRVHLLSKKSQRLGRDTFFFRPSPYGYLLGGLNQTLTRATCATLNRWAVLLDPPCPPFDLRPVALKKCAILRYYPELVGPAIPPNSTALIEPGDYIIEERVPEDRNPFDFANITSPFIAFASNLESFAEIKAAAEAPNSDLKEFLHWYDFPAGFEDMILARDSHKCMTTGSTESLEVTWIFPPAWANAFAKKSYADNHQGLVVPSNAMLMQADLISAFHDNAFGIDVDDNYRIVVFQYAGRSKDALSPFCNKPAYLCHVPVCDAMQVFLREHFRRCILVKFRGGDILEDYPSEVILGTMEALCIGPDYYPDEVAPLNDPLWSTPLGREIFEDYMKTTIVPTSMTESSDEESIGDEPDG
ncbi:hypothetical protein CVT26_002863 [Gymnopilus dilepis]|uniref:HNH nuclease domain-containing protein n=1 Tax=Gymnopilus dilepis TaxID=231916 RepID=A0A409VT86_9AGAR|nr:hypothetical protein CVT26_002863 [Gymnopilus dilepis]